MEKEERIASKRDDDLIVRRKNIMIHHSVTLLARLLNAALGRDLILGIRFVLLANNPMWTVRREL